VAAALYVSTLVALVLSPFLLIEVMSPPRAGVDIDDPPIRLDFHQPRGRGDNHPAGEIRRGTRDGRKNTTPAGPPKPQKTWAVPRPADALAPPPEIPLAGGPTEGAGGSDRPYGDEKGSGTEDSGVVEGGCPGCTGTGGSGPGDPEGPYDQGTAGLTPPSLVPGTRALPRYPDLARRAGLQGTVILLVVVEKDGTVGTIEIIKSPDQRWGFDLSAIDAVKRWRYQPALMNGSPVAAYIQVMIEFTLAR
jgi:protein TonB